MKTCNFLTCACITIAILLAGYQAQAQQTKGLIPINTTGSSNGADYTYKIFEAPNKMYGYDIFRDGKIIFHQGASSLQSNNAVTALSKKEHADQAALLAIKKIKKNQPATLTQEELEKITIK